MQCLKCKPESNAPLHNFVNITLLRVVVIAKKPFDVEASYRFELPDPEILWHTGIDPNDALGLNSIVFAGIIVMVGIFCFHHIRLYIIRKIEEFAATLPN
ncbi:hypothetical protein MTO96_037995 [Rhipicephalus appendiculatus]